MGGRPKGFPPILFFGFESFFIRRFRRLTQMEEDEIYSRFAAFMKRRRRCSLDFNLR